METRKSGGHWSWGRRGGWGRGPGCKGQPGEEGDAPPLRREGREAGRRGTRLKHVWAFGRGQEEGGEGLVRRGEDGRRGVRPRADLVCGDRGPSKGCSREQFQGGRAGLLLNVL